MLMVVSAKELMPLVTAVTLYSVKTTSKPTTASMALKAASTGPVPTTAEACDRARGSCGRATVASRQTGRSAHDLNSLQRPRWILHGLTITNDRQKLVIIHATELGFSHQFEAVENIVELRALQRNRRVGSTWTTTRDDQSAYP